MRLKLKRAKKLKLAEHEDVGRVLTAEEEKSTTCDTPFTKLAESGAGDETIMAIAGHVSRRMLSRYAHIRTEAKRRALESVATQHHTEPLEPVFEGLGHKNGHNFEILPN